MMPLVAKCHQVDLIYRRCSASTLDRLRYKPASFWPWTICLVLPQFCITLTWTLISPLQPVVQKEQPQFPATFHTECHSPMQRLFELLCLGYGLVLVAPMLVSLYRRRHTLEGFNESRQNTIAITLSAICLAGITSASLLTHPGELNNRASLFALRSLVILLAIWTTNFVIFGPRVFQMFNYGHGSNSQGEMDSTLESQSYQMQMCAQCQELQQCKCFCSAECSGRFWENEGEVRIYGHGWIQQHDNINSQPGVETVKDWANA